MLCLQECVVVGQPSGNTPADLGGQAGGGSQDSVLVEAHYTAVPAMSTNPSLAGEIGKWSGSVPPPPNEDDLVGTTLSNTYKIVGVLGEGGMGRVYEAQHTRIQSKRFALKALHPEFARRKDILARFQREVEAAASINSPHVVGVYDVDQTEDGRPFLVSELLQGKELGDYLDDAGKIAVPFAVRIVRQICKALIAAHERGVVHRDMKPENVFLAGDVHEPVVKVLDFGISRLEGQQGNTLTKTGFIMGTPSYMAPEQAKGERVDHRADIYSVGAILYQCVTGKVPFDRSDATATLAAVLTEEPERPRSIAPDVPEHIEMIIQTAMARSPSDRYQSMLEFDAALAPYDESDTIFDEPSRSMRMPALSLVETQSVVREISDARPLLIVLGSLLTLSILSMLVIAIAAIMRLSRGGATPTITATEALVMALILMAAFTTPFVLLVRHLKRTVWGNTAKVLDLVRSLRDPLLVGLASYGVLAVMLRVLETVLLRSPFGIAWPVWDLMLPLVGVIAGVVVYGAKRAKGVSLLDRLGTTASVSVGLFVVVTMVATATALRDDAPASPGVDKTEAAAEGSDESSAGDDGEATEASAPEDDVQALGVVTSSTPIVNKEAFAQWDKVLGDMKLGKVGDAIANLALLAELDPNAASDGNVKKGLVLLAVRACLPGSSHCDKMITLLTDKLGPHGIDVLFEIIVTKGGTIAHTNAVRLLKDPEIRKRGTVAMNVAYELRTAPNCDAKRALFARVREDGDYRALRELDILRSGRQCRAVNCCLESDDEWKATRRALMDKQ